MIGIIVRSDVSVFTRIERLRQQSLSTVGTLVLDKLWDNNAKNLDVHTAKLL